MGVISKNDPKLGIFASSEESLNVPESSDDERSSNGSALPQVSEIPRRIHGRFPIVPMSFDSQRKCRGRKKTRRIENVNQLMTLIEDEELGEVTIYDFIPKSNDIFQRLLQDKEALEIWNNFVENREDVQSMIVAATEFHRRSKQILKPNEVNIPLTGEQAFQTIKTGLRNVLKKNRVPLGMLECLENELVDFFNKMPHKTYVSPSSLSSYERLLLHAVSQYHQLISKSFDSEDRRKVKVFNPHMLYQSPQVLLKQYLEDKQNMGTTVH